MHCTEMELVVTESGKFYWLLNCPGIGIAQSIGYNTPQEAIKAVLSNQVKWLVTDWRESEGK